MSTYKRAGAFTGHFDQQRAGESAASLGRSGRKVEDALARLKSAEPGSEERDRRLKAAVETVYYFFIQRETWGQHDHAEAIALYAIPDEVLRRLGSC